jgi:site-specific DNA-methyltransferase (adenine-specific)
MEQIIMKQDKTQVFNMDCMEYMQSIPDGYFELAIVDPPYGIGEANEKRMHSRGHTQKKYKGKSWDLNAPDSEYFDLLKRKSKNQIIWGANHFIDNIPFNVSSSCWIVWDKDVYGDFADGELAWTSFNTALRIFKWTWNGFRKQMPEERFHPTQKPIKLYEWLLINYAKEGDKILDTHLGSQSSRIAAYNLGFEFIGTELDQEYFEQGCNRFDNHKKQLTLF